jgi:hypothetical protein
MDEGENHRAEQPVAALDRFRTNFNQSKNRSLQTESLASYIWSQPLFVEEASAPVNEI